MTDEVARYTRRGVLLAAVTAAAAAAVCRYTLSPRGPSSKPVPRRVDNVRAEHEGGDLLLTPLPAKADGPVFRLNGPAALIWEQVDGRRTVREIAAPLAATYRIGARRALCDTRECLGSLARTGLVWGVGRA